MFLNLILSMRIKHWIKNLFVFIPLLISGSFFDIILIKDTSIAFLCFCFASSSVYFFNDIVDIRKDRNHPEKKNRPIASGKISIITAVIFTLFLLFVIFYLQTLVEKKIFIVIIAYIILNINYSTWLKKISIVDITCISIGFVLRVQAGVIAIGLDSSIWLISMTFTLSMLLALGKRKVELVNYSSFKSRDSLKGYTESSIQNMQNIFISCIMIFYLLYANLNTTFDGNIILLYISTIFVISGLLRYVQLISMNRLHEEPTDILYKDKFIMISVCLWGLTILFSYII